MRDYRHFTFAALDIRDHTILEQLAEVADDVGQALGDLLCFDDFNFLSFQTHLTGLIGFHPPQPGGKDSRYTGQDHNPSAGWGQGRFGLGKKQRD